MIKFKGLLIEGFGSIRDEIHFNLDRKGTTLLRGRNGSGKTTVINAFIWALYGVNLKGLNLAKLPTKSEYRTKSFRGTRVCLEIEKDGTTYLVARHIKFNGETEGITGKNDLLIFEEEDEQLFMLDFQHKDDSQEFITEELIGIDSKVFTNSILFGQRMKRFIEASPSEKREIFESIFEQFLSFIDVGKENASQKASELTEEIQESKSSIDKSEHLLENNEKTIEKLNEMRDTFENSKRAEIKELEQKIDLKEKEIQELEDDLTEPDELLEVDEELKDKLYDARSQLQSHRSSLALAKKSIPDDILRVCSTCGGDIPKDKFDELVSARNKKINEMQMAMDFSEKSIVKYESLVAELEEKLEDQKASEEINEIIKQEIKDNERIEYQIKLKNIELKNFESHIEKIEKDIQEADYDTEPYLIENMELKEIIEKEQEAIELLEARFEIIDWWKRTGFSSKGVKGHLLNSSLTLLNKAIHRYANKLGVNIRFSIDTSKASKPFITECFMKSVDYDYDEFSGGEKARIDVATAFAMHDLVSSSIQFNLLIMDEIFEGLDEEGIDDIFELINLKAQDKNLFIITHSTHIDSLNLNYLDFERINHTTKIK